MSKVKLLLDVVEDIRVLADSLQAVADVMVGSESEEQPNNQLVKEATAKKEPASGMTTITLEQIRAVLAEKSRSGHTAEVKALLTKRGADKLSDVDPKEYQSLLEDAEVL